MIIFNESAQDVNYRCYVGINYIMCYKTLLFKNILKKFMNHLKFFLKVLLRLQIILFNIAKYKIQLYIKNWKKCVIFTEKFKSA